MKNIFLSFPLGKNARIVLFSSFEETKKKEKVQNANKRIFAFFLLKLKNHEDFEMSEYFKSDLTLELEEKEDNFLTTAFFSLF